MSDTIKDGWQYPVRRLNIELPDRRASALWLPADYGVEDIDAIRLHLDLWSRIRGGITKAGRHRTLNASPATGRR